MPTSIGYQHLTNRGPKVVHLMQTLQCIGNVRFGSEADMCGAKSHVRFTPESGHLRRTSACLLWANSGHRWLIRSARRRDRNSMSITLLFFPAPLCRPRRPMRIRPPRHSCRRSVRGHYRCFHVSCRLAVSDARLALPNFYNVTIRIANVAARLAVLVLWLCDKFGSSISP
jgi:hypothetical protein